MHDLLKMEATTGPKVHAEKWARTAGRVSMQLAATSAKLKHPRLYLLPIEGNRFDGGCFPGASDFYDQFDSIRTMSEDRVHVI